MRKYIYAISLLTLFFCNKKQAEKVTDIDSQSFFLELTNVNKLENTKRKKLNDSTYLIKGVRDSLNITGYLTQKNQRIDWWKIDDSQNNKEIAIIEYRVIDNKEFANQYKIFKNSNLDIYRSKYYAFELSKDKESSSISYSFYIPKNDEMIKTKGKFLYTVHDINKNKEIISSECEFLDSDNLFKCTFSIPNENNIVVSGIFWELSEFKNGVMGGSEIYVLDTLEMSPEK